MVQRIIFCAQRIRSGRSISFAIFVVPEGCRAAVVFAESIADELINPLVELNFLPVTNDSRLAVRAARNLQLPRFVCVCVCFFTLASSIHFDCRVVPSIYIKVGQTRNKHTSSNIYTRAVHIYILIYSQYLWITFFISLYYSIIHFHHFYIYILNIMKFYWRESNLKLQKKKFYNRYYKSRNFKCIREFLYTIDALLILVLPSYNTFLFFFIEARKRKKKARVVKQKKR